MSQNYGLTSSDLTNVRNKIKNQEYYLENNKFTTATGQTKSLLDVSYSANLSKRYYPRILNKVNTFVSCGLDMDLVPIFLTVTLDGFFRDLMKGDFKRYKENREEYSKHIPNNNRSGYYLDYIDKGNTLTPKDLYKILGHQLHRFTKSTTLQNIRKNGLDYSMIRVTEPHKDGVPHFHILMYVPESYIPKLYSEFVTYFPAPQNHKKLIKNNKYSNSRNGLKIADGIYETYGFQTEVRNAAGYILKYILKSFANLIEDKEVDYLQAWYVHNRIPRIITTHTLVSQDVYHKVSVLDDDWFYLTNIKLNGNYERDADNNYFKFDDGHGRKIIGDNGLFMVVNNGKIVASYGSKKFTPKKVRLRSLKYTSVKPKSFNILERFIFYVPPTPYSYYITKVYDDGTLFCIGTPDDFFMTFDAEFINDVLPSDMFPVTKMSDYALFNHYKDFDFDVHNPARYALVNNEMINRGLIRAGYLDPNDFNMGFYDD